MLIQSTILTVILLHLGAKKGHTQLTHLEPEHDDDYFGDICEMQDSFKSPYIRAFYQAPRRAEGCLEEVGEGDDVNIRSTSTTQEIHVIQVMSSLDGRPGSAGRGANDLHLQQNGDARIGLRIKSAQESSTESLDKILFFVLVSDISIRWKIHLERINHSSELHFWVSNGSRVIHDRRLNMKIHQLSHQSSSELLLDWISQNLGPVTTIVEVQPSRSIVHMVGIADMEKMCQEITPERIEEEVSGCLVTRGKGRKNKDVHILELQDGANDATADGVPRSVTIDIHPKPNSKPLPPLLRKPLLRKHLMLVLKSHRPTRWKVQTAGLRGALDIVTDNAVDTTGVMMPTVGVVTERLSSLSGTELVGWTKEKYGEPTSYTYARLANKFDLTVDGQEEVSLDSDLTPRVICNPNSIIVSVSRRSLMNRFAAVRLSLTDLSCRVQKNRTHYFWTTLLTSCGTVRILRNNQTTYMNAITIRHMRSSYGQLSDHSGSGFEPQLDDENFDTENSGDIRIDYHCTYPIASMEEMKYELKLYEDSSFQLGVPHFPAVVSDNEMLFMEASVNQDSHMHLVIHNCTVLSPSSDQPGFPLIRNGCPYEERVEFLRTGSSSHSQRFQFVFQKSWSESNIECVLMTCGHNFHDSSAKIHRCPSPDQRCSSSAAEDIFDLTEAAVGYVSIGPLVLQDTPLAGTDFELQDGSTRMMMMMHDELRDDCDQIIHTEGLDPPAVVGIAFAAFTIGVLLTGALWIIHSHTGPIKKHAKGLRSAEASGESTPSSTAPMAIRPLHHHV